MQGFRPVDDAHLKSLGQLRVIHRPELNPLHVLCRVDEAQLDTLHVFLDHTHSTPVHTGEIPVGDTGQGHLHPGEIVCDTHKTQVEPFYIVVLAVEQTESESLDTVVLGDYLDRGNRARLIGLVTDS